MSDDQTEDRDHFDQPVTREELRELLLMLNNALLSQLMFNAQILGNGTTEEKTKAFLRSGETIEDLLHKGSALAAKWRDADAGK